MVRGVTGPAIRLHLGDPQDHRVAHQQLAARGVIADFRAPDIIRVAPIPLYGSFHDNWAFASILRGLLASPLP